MRYTLRQMFAAVALAAVVCFFLRGPIRAIERPAGDTASLIVHAFCAPCYDLFWLTGNNKAWPWDEDFNHHQARYAVKYDIYFAGEGWNYLGTFLSLWLHVGLIALLAWLAYIAFAKRSPT
jgi:hypothetical protein